MNGVYVYMCKPRRMNVKMCEWENVKVVATKWDVDLKKNKRKKKRKREVESEC